MGRVFRHQAEGRQVPAPVLSLGMRASGGVGPLLSQSSVRRPVAGKACHREQGFSGPWSSAARLPASPHPRRPAAVAQHGVGQQAPLAGGVEALQVTALTPARAPARGSGGGSGRGCGSGGGTGPGSGSGSGGAAAAARVPAVPAMAWAAATAVAPDAWPRPWQRVRVRDRRWFRWSGLRRFRRHGLRRGGIAGCFADGHYGRAGGLCWHLEMIPHRVPATRPAVKALAGKTVQPWSWTKQTFRLLLVQNDMFCPPRPTGWISRSLL